MAESRKTYGFVTLIGLIAVGSMIQAYTEHLPFPGLWGLATFVLVIFLLELTSSPLRVEAVGSTSFILHMASGLLFGGFWGGLVTATATSLHEIVRGNKPVRFAFNVAQRTLCVTAGFAVYKLLGGSIPPAYLAAGASLRLPEVQRDLGLFFVISLTYFSVNTIALNTVIAWSTGRVFKEVWNLNAKGVLGYDLGGSCLAVLLAWLYTVSERLVGLGAVGFILVLVPILAIRHVYGLYRKLQNSGRELLDLMVKAIEARDPYTSGHSVRVATISKAIAQELRMNVEEVEEVYTSALLHDVGKIHEEFAPLLRKESKLTPEETALLQTHPIKSAELVGLISSFRGNVLNSVRHHHERWDGGGYPDGVAGEQIPLGARIIMMADTADAMTTDRPYRRRLSIDAVVSEFQKYKGSQFDPKLVDLVITSVTMRRVLAELQGAEGDESKAQAPDGGSRKVAPPAAGRLVGARSSWRRIRIGSF
jgi:HD-GYP domain-containing protein (c-di-GMP phosphodiesterase class II)